MAEDGDVGGGRGAKGEVLSHWVERAGDAVYRTNAKNGRNVGGSVAFKKSDRCGRAGDFRLTGRATAANVAAPLLTRFFMKVCSITQARPMKGRKIHRRGLAKKKGGIAQHVPKAVSRTFDPNLKKKRAWDS